MHFVKKTHLMCDVATTNLLEDESEFFEVNATVTIRIYNLWVCVNSYIL